MAKAAVEMAVLDAELRAAGESFGHRLGAVRRPGAGRGVDRDHRRPRLAARPWSISTSPRAIAGSSSRSSPASTSSGCGRSVEHVGPDVLIQVDANAAYTVADADHLAAARRVRSLADRAAAADRRHRRSRRARSAVPHADLPRRVDHLGRHRRRRHRPWARRRSSTSRPAGSAATSRRCAVHDVCAGARRAGVVRRDAGDRARPGRQPRPRGAARTSRCPATRRPRPATGPPT